MRYTDCPSPEIPPFRHANDALLCAFKEVAGSTQQVMYKIPLIFPKDQEDSEIFAN